MLGTGHQGHIGKCDGDDGLSRCPLCQWVWLLCALDGADWNLHCIPRSHPGRNAIHARVPGLLVGTAETDGGSKVIRVVTGTGT